MTKGKTTLIRIDPPQKGTTPNNYTPIKCPPMMWKILTAQSREKNNYSLISYGLLLKEQKCCRKGTRETGDLL